MDGSCTATLSPALADGSLFDTEARRAVRELVAKNAWLPPDELANLVVAVCPGAEWPLRRAAAEALLARIGAADVAKLRARPNPRRGGPGWYRVRGAAGDATVDVLVSSLAPARASCACADYLTNALGHCAHTVAAVRAARTRSARTAPLAPRALFWDPVSPLVGADAPVARLRLDLRCCARPSALRRWVLHDGRLALPTGRERAAAVRALRHAAGDDAEPAAIAVLDDELRRLERAGGRGLEPERVDEALASLRLPLYPYQREGVLRFLEAGRLLLADDMGLGKTAQAIAACHVLVSLGRIERALVVAPASLKPQWLREWRTFSPTPVSAVEGTPAERAERYHARERGVLLIGYEQLQRDLEQVRAFGPELVVLDEAQRTKNAATKTAHCVAQLAPRYRLALTGTPMENRLDELASVLGFVDERALEPRWRLEALHTDRIDGKREIRGARNLSALRERLAPFVLRRLRREVLGQLPARQDTQVPVPLSEGQAAAHAELDTPIRRLAQQGAQRPLTRPEFLRLMALLTQQRLICDGLALHEFEARWPELRDRAPDRHTLAALDAPKLAELRALLEEVVVRQGRKVVVFSQWRRMLQLLEWATRDVLASHGVRAVFFTGQERARRRAHNLVEFHDDPAARVLFATDAGGVGLNLQHAADAVINVEPPWNPAVLEQRVGRVHRNGQTRPVDVFHLSTSGGIEARICALVGNKRALFDGLFDSTADQIGFARAGSFLSRLEQVMAPTPCPPAPTPTAPTPLQLVPPIEPPTTLTPNPGKPGVAEALAGIEVRRAADGTLMVRAAPAAAGVLIGVLEGLTELLRAAA